MGRGGVRKSAHRRQAHLSFRRLFHLPLVPRDGARIVRERGAGGDSESLVRAGEGGSRGAAGRGPHLHDVRAGLHRQRRLADVGVPDAGAEAVLRRHLFSAGQSLRAAGLRRDSGAHRRSVAQRARPHRAIERRRGRAARAICGRGRTIDRASRTRRCSIPRSSISAACSIRRMADSEARPSFRARWSSISCCDITRDRRTGRKRWR